MVCMMNFSRKVLAATKPLKTQFLVALIAVVGPLMSLSSVAILAQSPSPPPREAITVEGTVRNSAGELLWGASVRLEEKEWSNSLETKTKADGSFVFLGLRPGVYTVRAEKSGWREGVSNPLVLKAGDKKRIDVVLESLVANYPGASGASSSSGSAAGAMELDDKPNFTVAGVTDWNNTGMHGSDVNVRTSEALAKETLALKNGGLAEKPTADTKGGATSLNSSESEKKLRVAREQARKMLANADTAGGHRLLGELNERLGDPLEAVREYERAALMDASEESYFEWGDFGLAIRDYKKAIEISPQIGEAHYRLGSAYRRIGEESKAEQEFREYEKIEKAETAAIESQRRELRQFLIILKDQPAGASPH